MKKFFFVIAMIALSLGSFGQGEIPPSQANLNSVRSPSIFVSSLPDSLVWLYRGSSLGWSSLPSVSWLKDSVPSWIPTIYTQDSFFTGNRTIDMSTYALQFWWSQGASNRGFNFSDHGIDYNGIPSTEFADSTLVPKYYMTEVIHDSLLNYEPLLPPTPEDPTFKFLDGNRQWSTVSLGAGAGYAANIYYRLDPSDVPGYLELNYDPGPTETEVITVVSGGGTVLAGTFLYPDTLATDRIDAGEWVFFARMRVDITSGVTRTMVVPFVRHLNGTETNLDTIYSPEINNTEYLDIAHRYSEPGFTVDPSDRAGVRVYITTTAINPITLYTIIGDGHGAYLNIPIRTRHSQLRNLNEDPNYQHVTTDDISNWDIAYGWGDWSTGVPAAAMTFTNKSGNISQWANDVGYITGYTETDPFYTSSSWYTTTNNSSNWNTAYGWGNWATGVPAAAMTFTNKSGNISQWTNDVGYITSAFALSGDLSGTLANPVVNDDGHNHTSLTGVTSISFAMEASDAASITRSIDGANSHFDFNLSDDLSQTDNWRWRFSPSGGTLYDAMALEPTAQDQATLSVYNVAATTFNGGSFNGTTGTFSSNISPILNLTREGVGGGVVVSMTNGDSQTGSISYNTGVYEGMLLSTRSGYNIGIRNDGGFYVNDVLRINSTGLFYGDGSNLTNITHITGKGNVTAEQSGVAISPLYPNQTVVWNSYSDNNTPLPYMTVLSASAQQYATIQIAGSWGDDTAHDIYWRYKSDRSSVNYFSNWFKFYTDYNANATGIDWSAKNLNLNGAISGATTITANNDITITGGASRNVNLINSNNANGQYMQILFTMGGTNTGAIYSYPSASADRPSSLNVFNYANAPVWFGTNNLVRGGFSAAGNLLIGTETDYSSKLTVNGGVRIMNSNTPTSGAGLELQYNTGTTNAYIQGYDRSAGAFRTIVFNNRAVLTSTANLYHDGMYSSAFYFGTSASINDWVKVAHFTGGSQHIVLDVIGHDDYNYPKFFGARVVASSFSTTAMTLSVQSTQFDHTQSYVGAKYISAIIDENSDLWINVPNIYESFGAYKVVVKHGSVQTYEGETLTKTTTEPVGLKCTEGEGRRANLGSLTTATHVYLAPIIYKASSNLYTRANVVSEGNYWTGAENRGYWIGAEGSFTAGMFYNASSLRFRAGNTVDKMTINTNGQVSIAGATAGDALTVSQTVSGVSAAYLQNLSATGNGLIVRGGSGTSNYIADFRNYANSSLATILGNGRIDAKINGNISGGNIFLGATTDNTTKYFSVVGKQYASSSEPEGISIISGSASSTANVVAIGGYLAELNAATEVSIYAAGNTTTRTGTKMVSITSSGFNLMNGSMTITNDALTVAGKKVLTHREYGSGLGTVSLNDMVNWGFSSATDVAYQSTTFTDLPSGVTIGAGGFTLINAFSGSNYNLQIFSQYNSEYLFHRNSYYSGTGKAYKGWKMIYDTNNANLVGIPWTASHMGIGVAAGNSIDKLLVYGNGVTLRVRPGYKASTATAGYTTLEMDGVSTLYIWDNLESSNDILTVNGNITATNGNVLAGGYVYTKTFRSNSPTITYSATPTMNVNDGMNQTITLTGNVTTLTLTNVSDGNVGDIVVIQNATGGYGINAFAASGFNIRYINEGTRPTAANINSNPNGVTVISYKAIGTYLFITFGNYGA